MRFFAEKEPWYKCNLHAHTTVSDGRLTPEEACAAYRAMGYDVLALTDHRKPGQNGRYQEMLLLAGVELDTMVGHQGYHIIGVGMDGPLEFAGIREPQGLIDAIRAAGGRAILGHPAWSLLLPQEMARLTGLTGAEVMNSVSRAPFNGNRDDSSVLLDITAACGSLLPFMAADDSHWYRGEQGASFIWVQAPALTREAILAALDQGRFIASQAPRIEQIEIADGKMRVWADGSCEMAVFYSDALWQGERVQTARQDGCFVYPITPNDRFLRCEVIDGRGRRAWSSPLSLEALR